mgnify:CR=1 FL=1
MSKKLENIVLAAGAVVIVWLMFTINKGINNEQLRKSQDVLIKSYQVESSIKSSQILELHHKLTSVETEAYTRGYEAGKLYMGVSQMQGKDSMVDYSDGYHAAVAQFYMDEQLKELNKTLVESEPGE